VVVVGSGRVSPVQAQILMLQRQAGNAAVGRLLRSRRMLQRDDLDQAPVALDDKKQAGDRRGRPRLQQAGQPHAVALLRGDERARPPRRGRRVPRARPTPTSGATPEGSVPRATATRASGWRRSRSVR